MTNDRSTKPKLSSIRIVIHLGDIDPNSVGSDLGGDRSNGSAITFDPNSHAAPTAAAAAMVGAATTVITPPSAEATKILPHCGFGLAFCAEPGSPEALALP